MQVSSKLLSLFLILEISVTVLGFFWYSVGPEPFTFVQNETNSETFGKKSDWQVLIVPFPTGIVHSKFALEQKFKFMINCTEPGLKIYLFNSSQVMNWSDSNREYVLLEQFPNYNFSINVTPDDYFVAINTSDAKINNTLLATSEVEVLFQNFNFNRIWPNLYLIFGGIAAANVTFFLMKKRGMFKIIDTFFRNRFLHSPSFPGVDAYSDYAMEFYDKFAKPLASTLVQLIPILFIIFVFIRSFPQGSSPFIGVAYDFTALSVISTYLFLLIIIPIFLVFLVLLATIPSELAFKVSKKLGFLRKSDVTDSSAIGSLVTSKLKEKKYIALLVIPLVILVAVIAREPFPQGSGLPTLFWTAIFIILSYYGLFFSYIQALCMREFKLSRIETKNIKHFGSRIRKQSLIRAITTTSFDGVFFAVFIGMTLGLLYYFCLPLLSSSLAVKYGLAGITDLPLTQFYVVIMQLVLLALLLIWTVFYGLTGYVVPELIERGAKTSFIGVIVFGLTFLTDKTLSTLFSSLFAYDWYFSLAGALMIAVIVLIFEKFYRKIFKSTEKKDS